MKNNDNKLFGGLGAEKAGELGGNATHKCRGRECTEHASDTHSAHTHDKHNQDKATSHKSSTEHSKDKHAHAHDAEKSAHKAVTHNKKD